MDQHIIEKIGTERILQDKLHPLFPQGERLAILMEEVGEVATALQNGDNVNLEDELIQVAAVCVRWLESLKQAE